MMCNIEYNYIPSIKEIIHLIKHNSRTAPIWIILQNIEEEENDEKASSDVTEKKSSSSSFIKQSKADESSESSFDKQSTATTTEKPAVTKTTETPINNWKSSWGNKSAVSDRSINRWGKQTQQLLKTRWGNLTTNQPNGWINTTNDKK